MKLLVQIDWNGWQTLQETGVFYKDRMSELKIIANDPDLLTKSLRIHDFLEDKILKKYFPELNPDIMATGSIYETSEIINDKHRFIDETIWLTVNIPDEKVFIVASDPFHELLDSMMPLLNKVSDLDDLEQMDYLLKNEKMNDEELGKNLVATPEDISVPGREHDYTPFVEKVYLDQVEKVEYTINGNTISINDFHKLK